MSSLDNSQTPSGRKLLSSLITKLLPTTSSSTPDNVVAPQRPHSTSSLGTNLLHNISRSISRRNNTSEAAAQDSIPQHPPTPSPPPPTTRRTLLPTHKADIFLSHAQADGGDACHCIAAALVLAGYHVWFDMMVENLTATEMASGVKNSNMFMLFLTDKVLESWYVAMEVSTALKLGDNHKMVLVVCKNNTKSTTQILTELVLRISSSSELAVPGYSTPQALLHRFGNQHVIYHPGLPNKAFLNQLLPAATPLLLSSPPSSGGAPPLLLLTCAHDVGLDQIVTLQLEFARRNVLTGIIIDANTARLPDGSETTISLAITPLIVFLTQNSLRNPHLCGVINAAVATNGVNSARLVCLHEADGRRAGSMQIRRGAIMTSFFDGTLLSDMARAALHIDQSIAYTKQIRSISFISVLLDRLMGLAGLLAPQFQAPDGIFRPWDETQDPPGDADLERVLAVFTALGSETDESSREKILYVVADNEEEMTRACATLRRCEATVALHICNHDDGVDADTASRAAIRSLGAQLLRSLPHLRYSYGSKENVEDLCTNASTLNELASICLGRIFHHAHTDTSMRGPIPRTSSANNILKNPQALIAEDASKGDEESSSNPSFTTPTLPTSASDQQPVLGSNSSMSFLSFVRKHIVVCADVRDATFARALAGLADQISPIDFGLVIVCLKEYEDRASSSEFTRVEVKDLDAVDVERVFISRILSVTSSSSTRFLVNGHTATSVRGVRHWDIMVSYVAGEGDDAARSLAQDLRQHRVWFDVKRASLDGTTARLGVENSNTVLFVITTRSGTDPITQLEMQLCKERQQPYFMVIESDPMHGGGMQLSSYLTSQEQGAHKACWLRRIGAPREAMLSHISNCLFVTQDDATNTTVPVPANVVEEEDTLTEDASSSSPLPVTSYPYFPTLFRRRQSKLIKLLTMICAGGGIGVVSWLNGKYFMSWLGFTSTLVPLWIMMRRSQPLVQEQARTTQHKPSKPAVVTTSSSTTTTTTTDETDHNNPITDDVENIDILMTGIPQVCADQCAELCTIFQSKGISAKFAEDPTHFIKHTKALLIYATDGVLASETTSSAVVAMSARRKLGNKVACVMVHEGDAEREGAPLHSTTLEFDARTLTLQAKDNHMKKFLADTTSYPNNQETRRPGEYQDALVKKILDEIFIKTGEQLPLTVLTPFNPYNIAQEKARELEPGTREWLFDRLDQWYFNGGAMGAFVLLAGAGVGKSVVMAEVARRGNSHLALRLGGSSSSKHAKIVALHFFRSTDPLAKSTETALRSIAMQMRSAIVDFTLPTEDEIRREVGRGVAALLELLLLEPARACSRSATAPKLVVLLDALDECAESEALCDAIQKKWHTRPPWLLLVTSARPGDVISRSTLQFRPVTLRPTSQENDADLRSFLECRMVLWGAVDRERAVLAVLQQSEGLFIWVKFQEREIRTMASTTGVTEEAIKSLPKGVRHVYSSYFDQLMRALGQTKYRSVVATALLAPRDFVPLSLWRRSLDHLSDEEFENEISIPASKLLLFEKVEGAVDGDVLIKSPHKSMLDWLTGPATDKTSAMGMGRQDLAVKALHGDHAKLAVACEAVFREMSNIPCCAKAEELSLAQRFAVGHAAYHFALACKAVDSSLVNDYRLSAVMWFTQFDRLYRMVAESIAMGQRSGMSRILNDVEFLLSVCDEVHDEIARDHLIFIGSLLRLSADALLHEPRELAGQTLGRIDVVQQTTDGATPLDELKSRLCQSASAWINTSLTYGVSVAKPNPWFSGLAKAGGALKRILEGHTANVLSVVLSPDCRHCLSASTDTTVRLFDLTLGLEVMRFEGHSSEVKTVTLSPDGKRALSGSRDMTAIYWNVETGDELVRLRGHTGFIGAVSLSASHNLALTGSDDGSARLWNLVTAEELRRFYGHTEEVYSVCLDTDNVLTCLTAGHDRTIVWWDVQTGKFLGRCVGHVEGISTTMFRPGSQNLECFSASHDRTARLWHLPTQACLQIYSGGEEGLGNISCNQRLLMTASRDNTARIFEIDSGKEVHVIRGPASFVNAVSLSQDGKHALTANQKTIRFWDLTQHDVAVAATTDAAGAAAAAKEDVSLNRHVRPVVSCTLSADGCLVATGSIDGTAIVWDTTTGQALRRFVGHTSSVESVSFDSFEVSNICLTGGADNCVRVWSIHDGQCMWLLEMHKLPVVSLSLCTSKSICVSGSMDSFAYIWSLATGTCLQALRFSDEQFGIFSVALSSNADMIVMGSGGGHVGVWELPEDVVHIATAAAAATTSGGGGGGRELITQPQQLRAEILCHFNVLEGAAASGRKRKDKMHRRRSQQELHVEDPHHNNNNMPSEEQQQGSDMPKTMHPLLVSTTSSSSLDGGGGGGGNTTDMESSTMMTNNMTESARHISAVAFTRDGLILTWSHGMDGHVTKRTWKLANGRALLMEGSLSPDAPCIGPSPRDAIGRRIAPPYEGVGYTLDISSVNYHFGYAAVGALDRTFSIWSWSFVELESGMANGGGGGGGGTEMLDDSNTNNNAGAMAMRQMLKRSASLRLREMKTDDDSTVMTPRSTATAGSFTFSPRSTGGGSSE